jgi:RNA polymerase sigma-70 factor (ECF subfamily)
VDAVTRRLELLYRTRYVGYRRALATIAGSHEAAHDAVQEGFARALRGRGGYRGGSLEAWLWRILLRAARDQRTSTWADLDGIDPVVLAPEANPEVSAAVRALSPRRRLVVFLHYYADLSYSDIAEVLDIEQGTVAATLAQSRAALLHALDERQVKP